MAHGENTSEQKEKGFAQEFLQIFTPRIQALVYLWLEKPNIARAMRSQSSCVLYCVPKAAGMYAQAPSVRLSVLQVTPGRARRLVIPLTKQPATQEGDFRADHTDHRGEIQPATHSAGFTAQVPAHRHFQFSQGF